MNYLNHKKLRFKIFKDTLKFQIYRMKATFKFHHNKEKNYTELSQ
jgi:hypothetical protein